MAEPLLSREQARRWRAFLRDARAAADRHRGIVQSVVPRKAVVEVERELRAARQALARCKRKLGH